MLVIESCENYMTSLTHPMILRKFSMGYIPNQPIQKGSLFFFDGCLLGY